MSEPDTAAILVEIRDELRLLRDDLKRREQRRAGAGRERDGSRLLRRSTCAGIR